MTNLQAKLKQYGFLEPDNTTNAEGFDIAHFYFKGGHIALTCFADRPCAELTIDYGDLLLSESIDDVGGDSYSRNGTFESASNFIKFLKGTK